MFESTMTAISSSRTKADRPYATATSTQAIASRSWSSIDGCPHESSGPETEAGLGSRVSVENRTNPCPFSCAQVSRPVKSHIIALTVPRNDGYNSVTESVSANSHHECAWPFEA